MPGYGYSYGYGSFYAGDVFFLLGILMAVIVIIASLRVKTVFNKYNKVQSRAGMTGQEAATRILKAAGIYDVTVSSAPGELTDHYDPRSKSLHLSESTFQSRSVAAIGVAAHEAGHAIQHSEGYKPLVLRSTLVPVANIGSKLGIPLVILGMILSYNYILIQIGIWVFAIAVFFQLVTLPVEFNASGKAMRLLENQRILQEDEIKQCRKVLGAAAMTYVAAAAASLIQLLRLIALGGRRRD